MTYRNPPAQKEQNTGGSRLITHGSAFITHGSAFITHGSAFITHGSALLFVLLAPRCDKSNLCRVREQFRVLSCTSFTL
jgi:hypothetical protein